MKFRGLQGAEIEQLSPEARKFAAAAASARRRFPFYVKAYGFAEGLKQVNVKIGGPFFISIPVEFCIELIVAALSSVICSAIEESIASARPRALVLWLRRFHQSGEGRFRMHEVFEGLSAWGVLACTLSDDVVYKSTLAERDIRRWVTQRVVQLPEMSWIFKLLMESIFFLGLLSAVGLAFVLIAFRGFSSAVEILAAITFIVLAVVSLRFISRAIMRLFCHTKRFQEIYRPMFAAAMAEAFTLPADAADSFFEKTTRDLVNQYSTMDRGFLALVVADADWQVVVRAAVDHAQVILVDVSEISDNLAWELRQIAERDLLHRVVTCFGFERLEAPSADVWQQHPSCSALDTYLGEAWRADCQKFSYPSFIEEDNERSTAASFSRHLVMAVYEAAANSGR
jgi:hypothetical protein